MARGQRLFELSQNKAIVDEKKGMVLIGELALLALLVLFVETMLVPALPRIGIEYNETASNVAWVLTTYTLVGAVSVAVLGKLGEMHGRKKVLLGVMIAYIIGLVGCALSWNLPSLLAFRALQGVGMGAIPLLLGMVRDALPSRLVPAGIGLISAMIGVGAAMGLVLGGFMISALGWKGIFLAVAPLVAVVAAVIMITVHTNQAIRPGSLDLGGSGLLGACILALLLALSQGGSWGWSSAAIVGLFAVSLITAITFVYWERRVNEPLMDLSLLRNRNIQASYASIVFVGMGLFMLYQTIPYFLVLPPALGGFGVTDQTLIGLYLLPSALTQLFFAAAGGSLGQRIGPGRTLILGLVTVIIGLITLIMLRSSEVGVLLGTSIFGAGAGLAIVGNMNMLSNACSKDDFGSASGVSSMLQTVGMSAGPVVASLILAQFIQPSLGFAWTWGAAGALSAMAIVIVLATRAHLGVTTQAECVAE